MRDMLVNALKTKLIGQMNGHIANIEVMLDNPTGGGRQSTIVDTVDKELSALEHVNGKLNNLIRYFERRQEDATPKKEESKSK